MKKEEYDKVLEEMRKALEIDRDSLDDEAVQQPQLFFKISEQAVLAIDAKDRAKAEIAKVDAGLYAKAKKKIEQMGDRVSDAKIATIISTLPEHEKAVEKHHKAKYRAEVLTSLKESFSERASMLKLLASLYVAGYYGGSSVTGGSGPTAELAYGANKRRMAEKRKPLKK